jgi:divalent metal cation (Fe/Co/Zn/Cd) transporter
VERAIRREVPEVASVQTHLEPLTEDAPGTQATARDVAGAEALVVRIVREETGAAPRELRFLHTDEGFVAYLTLGVDGATPLAEAHARASRIEERVRRERPDIADVIVHTEP